MGPHPRPGPCCGASSFGLCCCCCCAACCGGMACCCCRGCFPPGTNCGCCCHLLRASASWPPPAAAYGSKPGLLHASDPPAQQPCPGPAPPAHPAMPGAVASKPGLQRRCTPLCMGGPLSNPGFTSSSCSPAGCCSYPGFTSCCCCRWIGSAGGSITAAAAAAAAAADPGGHAARPVKKVPMSCSSPCVLAAGWMDPRTHLLREAWLRPSLKRSSTSRMAP